LLFQHSQLQTKVGVIALLMIISLFNDNSF